MENTTGNWTVNKDKVRVTHLGGVSRESTRGVWEKNKSSYRNGVKVLIKASLEPK